MADKVVFLTTTGAGTWTVPADWTNTNKVETIGGGGGGRVAAAGGGGGGGGAYSSRSNITTFTPGTTVVDLSVGAGGAAGAAGGDTWFGATSLASSLVGAKGGGGATSATGATGGASASGFPTSGGTRTSGGDGGLGNASVLTGGGGGGAGGPGGTGGVGGAGDATTAGADFGGGGGSGAGLTTAGGAGGAGTTAAGAGGTNATGGGSGGAGGSGAGVNATAATGMWTSTHLPDTTTVSVVGAATGGGGGGGGSATTGAAGLGANYGGGGGGRGLSTGGTSTGGNGLIVITYTPQVPTLVQDRHRIRTDTASPDTAATWAAAEGADYTPPSASIGTSTPFRIRFTVSNTGAMSAAAAPWQIYASRNGGAYAPVTTASTFVKAANASTSADETAITSAQLTAGTGSRVNGLYDETGATGNFALNAGNYTELEFGIVLDPDQVAEGDTYDFRVYYNDTALTTYSDTPRVTVPTETKTPPRKIKGYQFSNNASTLTGQSVNKLIEPSGAAAGTWAGQSISANAQLIGSWFTPPNDPGGATISYAKIRLNVTTGNTNLRFAVRLVRVDSTGAVLATGLFSAETSSGASATYSLEPPVGDLGTFAATDQLRVGVRVRNISASAGQSCTVTYASNKCTALLGWSTADMRLSYADKGSLLTLSNTDKSVARVTTGATYKCVFPTVNALGTGSKVVFEFTIDSTTADATNFSIGVVTGSDLLATFDADANTFLGATATSWSNFAEGSAWANNALAATGGVTLVNAHRYQMCVDTDNDKVWIRDLTTAGSWDNNATSDPATNTGGRSFSMPNPVWVGLNTYSIGDSATFYFDSLTGSIPSGFTKVDGSSIVPAVSFTANAVATSSPAIGTPAFAQTHGLTATAAATGSPAVGLPTLGQTHGLTATAVATSSPATSTVTFGQTHGLTATAIATASPAFGTATFGQKHALTAAAVATSSPAIVTPAIGQTHGLTATAIVTASPATSTVTFGQTHGLSANAVAPSAPVLGTPLFGQVFGMTANAVATGAPAVGSPAFAQTHTFAATAVVTAAPAIAAPAIGQMHLLSAANLSTAPPAFGTAAFSQQHLLSANGIATASPDISSPLFYQNRLTVSPVATAAPAIGTPALGQVHQLTASSVATSAPDIGHPDLTEIFPFTASPIAVAAPAIGTPVLGQVHQLSANAVATLSPDIGHPATVPVASFTATAVATGAPAIGAVTLGQKHLLVAVPVAVGSPQAGTPAFGQVHALTTGNVVPASPQVGHPGLSQVHGLNASDVATGAPAIGTPGFAAVSGLIAQSVETSAPSIGTPAVGQVYRLIAVSAAVDAPEVGHPGFAQAHALNARDVATARPAIVKPALGQVHYLYPVDVATGSPAVGHPALRSGRLTFPTADAIIYGLTSNSVVLGEANRAIIYGITSLDTIVGGPR